VQQSALTGMLGRLASLRLTLVILLLLGVSVTLAYFNEVRTSPWLVLSLALLAVNLLAAVATNRRFRRQVPLLIFHLALLAIVVLVAVGRLTYLKGRVEVVEGQEFEGQLIEAEAGPWHPWGELAEARFTNLGFRIQYAPGLLRLGTQNRVAWTDEQGRPQETLIGDHKPLVRNHYRFYANWNKGFALLFGWQPRQGGPVVGSVNLPSYPANSLKQALKWSLPGEAEPIWAMLQFEGDLISEEAGGEFRLPPDYKVVVRYGDRRWELDPRRGTPTLDLPGGRLTYLGLRTWMGYQVAWDRTMTWLLAVSVIAALALGWHYWRKFTARPWNG
jgi:predicted ribosomally synthesized peptide with SipW-like signal peptide